MGRSPRTAEMLIESEVALVGSPQQLVEKILKLKDRCGYEDIMFAALFEKAGFAGREIEDMMQYFAEECAPELRRACSGGPVWDTGGVPALAPDATLRADPAGT